MPRAKNIAPYCGAITLQPQLGILTSADWPKIYKIGKAAIYDSYRDLQTDCSTPEVLKPNHSVGSSFLLTLQEQKAVGCVDIFKQEKFLHRMLSITILVASECKSKSMERWNQKNILQVAVSMQKGCTLLSEFFDSCWGKKKVKATSQVSNPRPRYIKTLL